MIALDAKTERTTTDDQPRVLVYCWECDEDVTREMIAECAAAAADFYDLADPVWFVDDDPAERFDSRPEASRLMAEVRAGDYLILSLTAIPVLVEFCDAMGTLLRQDVDVSVVEPDGSAFVMEEGLLDEYRKILYDAVTATPPSAGRNRREQAEQGRW